MTNGRTCGGKATICKNSSFEEDEIRRWCKKINADADAGDTQGVFNLFVPVLKINKVWEGVLLD
jgi:hypothetical protein